MAQKDLPSRELGMILQWQQNSSEHVLHFKRDWSV